MRILLLSLTVLALGLGGVFFAHSPSASAQSRHAAATIIGGNVGTSANHDAFVIALTKKTVVPGAYQFNINDFSTIHNFHLCKGTSCTGSNTLDTTTVSGTGPVSWPLTLALGTYYFQCDAHASTLHGKLVVAPSVQITSVVAKRVVVTVTAKASQATQFLGTLLKGTTVVTTKSASGTTVTLKLRPSTPLTPGFYYVTVRVGTAGAFNTVKKKIQVM